ncbi:uncharacterized protein LOC142340428 [Convolutriloba macropyga]|uniref:uncharacterized protein LOC142340428 n=1 Tax=Convolutriloba macropyga TaxID=536237 RepID=UPI003F521CBE
MLFRRMVYILAHFFRFKTASTSNDLTWMSQLDDDKYISQVTIPGTHDTAANFRNSHLCTIFCWCQNLSIPEQLDSGVRFLDIRLNHYHNMLRITHEFIYLNMNFSHVLDEIGEFFKKGPKETIVMRYREEYKDIDCNRSFSDTLQTYLDKYSGLFCDIKLNSDKVTELEIFKGEYQLVVNDRIVQKVRSQKDLGIIVKENLSWNDHAEERCKKATGAFFQIKKNLRLKTSQFLKLSAYCGYVMPILSYGSEVLLLNNAATKMIESVQRRATAWILSDSKSSYKKRLETLKILPVSLYFEMNDLLLLSSIVTGKVDINWQKYISFSDSRTRSSTKTLKINANENLKTRQKADFWYRTSTLANLLSTSVDLFHDTETLKTRLSDIYWEYFLEYYNELTSCTWHIRCGCPIDLFYFGAVVPQLKDVRGKIILINTGGGLCNNGSQGLCKRSDTNPLGAWTDETDADVWTPDCNPRKKGSCDEYIASLEANMMAANESSSNPPNEQLFYFTYTSANNGHKLAGPVAYARKVNPDIEQFLGSLEAPMSLGCVNMDFMNIDLARLIYNMNFFSVDSWTQNVVQEMQAVIARMKSLKELL